MYQYISLCQIFEPTVSAHSICTINMETRHHKLVALNYNGIDDIVVPKDCITVLRSKGRISSIAQTTSGW